jgi:hypothetical protein
VFFFPAVVERERESHQFSIAGCLLQLRPLFTSCSVARTHFSLKRINLRNAHFHYKRAHEQTASSAAPQHYQQHIHICNITMPHICNLCAALCQCSLHDTNVRSVMIDVEHARAYVAQDGEFLSFLQILARNLLQARSAELSTFTATYTRDPLRDASPSSERTQNPFAGFVVIKLVSTSIFHCNQTALCCSKMQPFRTVLHSSPHMPSLSCVA